MIRHNVGHHYAQTCTKTTMSYKQLEVKTSGMIFFSYLTDFSYFPLEKNCWKLPDTVKTGQWTQSEQVNGHSQNRSFKRGCRWLQLFFIDFQLFYFLTIIIPETCSWIINIWWYVSEQEGTNTQEEINKECTDGETTFIFCDVTKDQQVKVCEQTKGIFFW